MSNKLQIIIDYILESESGIADLLEQDDPNYKDSLETILSETENNVSDLKYVDFVSNAGGWHTIEKIEIPEDSFFDLTIYSMCKTKSGHYSIKSRGQRYCGVAKHKDGKITLDGHRWLKHHWGHTNSSNNQLRAAHYCLPYIIDEKTIGLRVNGRGGHELEWNVVYNLKKI